MSERQGGVAWDDRWSDEARPAERVDSNTDGDSTPAHKGPVLPWPSKSPEVAAVPPSRGSHGGAEVSGEDSSAPSPETEAHTQAKAVDEAPAAGEFARFTQFARPLTDRFRAEVLGAPPELIAHASTWLHDLSRKAINLDSVKATHGYNVRVEDLGVRDRAQGTAFLNHMAANGIARDDALRAIGFWKDINRNGGAAALLKAGRPAAPAASVPVNARSEIAAIEQRMRSDRRGYNRDHAMQARYRELIAARDA